MSNFEGEYVKDHKGMWDELKADALSDSFKAQLEVTRLKGEELVREYRMDCAKTLLRAGIHLIPSDLLKDHQFVVSRGVYEAAKGLVD